MNTPHTPGQHNNPHGGNWTVADYSEEQCEVVADGVTHVAFCNESPKGRANARLIASAPSLLAQRNELRAALLKLSSWFKSKPDSGAFGADEHLLAGCANELRGAIGQARAALAKGDK